MRTKPVSPSSSHWNWVAIAMFAGLSAACTNLSQNSTIAPAEVIAGQISDASWNRDQSSDIVASAVEAGFDLTALQDIPPQSMSGDLAALIGLALSGDEAPETAIQSALIFLERSCDAGQARACRNLAWNLTFRMGDTVSVAAAQPVFEKACALGNMLGCVDHANQALKAAATKHEQDTLLPKVKEYCDLEFDASCNLFALTLDKRSDHQRIVAELSEHCTPERPGVCFVVAFAHNELGQYSESLEGYAPLCDDGNLNACYNAGVVLIRNDYSGRDPALALKYTERACEQNHVGACFQLASLLSREWDIEHDYTRAAELFGQTCNWGYGRACYGLALLLEEQSNPMIGTEPLDPDGTLGRMAYERGCHLGDLNSCIGFAIYLDGGIGGERNMDVARQMLRTYCDRGSDLACEQLRVRLNMRHGIGSFEVAGETYSCDFSKLNDCLELGQSFFDGVNGNGWYPEVGLNILTTSCEAGSSGSCHQAARVLGMHPAATPEEQDKARALLQRGCDLGDFVTCQTHAEFDNIIATISRPPPALR